MKKKLISAAFVVAIALTAGYNVYNSQNKEALSDLALDNVEALANGEGSMSAEEFYKRTSCVPVQEDVRCHGTDGNTYSYCRRE